MSLFPQEALNDGVKKREVMGWALYDFANSGYTTVVLTAVYNAFFVGVVAQGADWATLAWTLIISASSLLIMLTLPAIGAHADLHAAKKRLLMLSTGACVLGTIALASTLIATVTGHPVTVYYPFLLWPLVTCAVFASVFAFLVQTAMQRHISPAQTALIFCLEPVFAAGYAFLAAGERLTAAGWLGALLILTGMVAAELLPDGTAAASSLAHNGS